MNAVVDQYRYASIAEANRAIREGKLTSVELVQDALERIRRLNPRLNAFITVMEEQALEAARQADREIGNGRIRSALHGIPVAVKDMYDTKGIPTTAGFGRYRNRKPARDAVVVEKLRNAGAVLLGKTNMDRLGMGNTGLTSDYGVVHNPWNKEFVTAGSSAGSSSAVAAGLCFATVDTDVIGSCRLPAACCGVTGFKPGLYLISPEGILAGEKTETVIHSFSQAGITTRSVSDTFILFNLLSEKPIAAEIFVDKNIRIGIATNYKGSAEVKHSFNLALLDIRSLGNQMVEIKVPFEMASFNSMSVNSDRVRIRQLLFKDVDVIVMPTMTDRTPRARHAERIGAQAVNAHNTMFCNYFGLPAISVPSGFDANDMPLGLQMVSYPNGEANVLDLADAYQQVTGWHRKHPRC